MSDTLLTFKCVTWNARGLGNKRTVIESLLYNENLDALSITETWLNARTPQWNINGYNSYRFDRRTDAKVGGGTLLLVRDSLVITNLKLQGSWDQHFEATGVMLRSIIGPIYLLSVYSPPENNSKVHHWIELLEKVPKDAHLIITGDFNAHYASHKPYKSNSMARIMMEIQEAWNLVLINEDTPTHFHKDGKMGNVLDLFFVSSSIAGMAFTQVHSKTSSSDHFPVSLRLPLKMDMTCQSSGRYRLNKVDWTLVENFLEKELNPLILEKLSGVDKYDKVTSVLTDSLLAAGAYIPNKKGNKSPVKPIWWNQDCTEAILKRKKARKTYICSNNKRNFDLYCLAEA